MWRRVTGMQGIDAPHKLSRDGMTLTFNMKLLVDYCFDMSLSCRDLQVSSLGILALNAFSFVRVDRLKFCCIILSGVDLQCPGLRDSNR